MRGIIRMICPIYFPPLQSIGMIAFGALYPLDNIRTRLQVQVHHKDKNVIGQSSAQSQGESASSANATQCSVAALTVSSNSCGDKAENKSSCLAPPVTPYSTGQLLSASKSQLAGAESVATTSSAATPVAAPQQPAARQVAEDEYRSAWDCAVKVTKKEGWSALYNGLTSGVVGVGVSSAIYFWWYYLLKRLALRATGSKNLTPGMNILVASVSGVINIAFTSPIWVINTRMSLQHTSQQQANAAGSTANTSYNGVVDAWTRIAREEGFAGLYRGFLPSLFLVSNPATQFVVYEQLTRLLTASRNRRLAALIKEAAAMGKVTKGMKTQASLTAVEAFVLAAVAKAVATLVTYPYQVVKSRQQADRGKTSEAPSMFTVMSTMLREEGMAVAAVNMRIHVYMTCILRLCQCGVSFFVHCSGLLSLTSPFPFSFSSFSCHAPGWQCFFQGLGTKLTQTVSNAALTFLIYEKIVEALKALMRATVRAAALARRAKEVAGTK